MSSLIQSMAAVLVAGALLGCASSRIPFTHEVRTQYRLSDDEVRNLQFYASHTITLRRELTATDRQVTGGHKLVLTSGKVIEEVVIEESTPGVAVAIGRSTIAVSFDVGSQLEFALRTGDAPPMSSVDASSRFAAPPDPFPGENPPQQEELPTELGNLLGKYWLQFSPGSAGQVPFQGQLFEALDESYKAHLLIDADTLDEVVENRTVLPGRTL